MAEITLDEESILASYAPPEVSFEAPPTIPLDIEFASEPNPDHFARSRLRSSSRHKDQPPEYAPGSASPSAISLPPDERQTFRRGNSPSPSKGAVPYSYLEPSTKPTIINSHDIAPGLSNAGVRGMITLVSHGTYHSAPATLILFSFTLRSGDHGFRFRNANIKITFSKHPSAKETDTPPTVVKFAPRKIYGLPTVEGKKNRLAGEFTLQVPIGSVTVGPSISVERETAWQKESRYKFIGNFWSSKHGNAWDVVYWDLRENKRSKEGIPDRVDVGVVVERGEGAFMAGVEVSVDTPVGNGIFGFPWKREAPAVFREGVSFGGKLEKNKFEELGEEEWRRLVPVDGEWESRGTGSLGFKSGEGSLSPLPESAPPYEVEKVKVDLKLLVEEESDDR